MIKDFLPLTLENSDVKLDIQWLEQLGNMVTNWKTQSLQFKLGGSTVTLQGDPSLCTCVFLKAMMRTLTKEGGGYWKKKHHK